MDDLIQLKCSCGRGLFIPRRDEAFSPCRLHSAMCLLQWLNLKVALTEQGTKIPVTFARQGPFAVKRD